MPPPPSPYIPPRIWFTIGVRDDPNGLVLKMSKHASTSIAKASIPSNQMIPMKSATSVVVNGKELLLDAAESETKGRYKKENKATKAPIPAMRYPRFLSDLSVAISTLTFQATVNRQL